MQAARTRAKTSYPRHVGRVSSETEVTKVAHQLAWHPADPPARPRDKRARPAQTRCVHPNPSGAKRPAGGFLGERRGNGRYHRARHRPAALQCSPADQTAHDDARARAQHGRRGARPYPASTRVCAAGLSALRYAGAEGGGRAFCQANPGLWVLGEISGRRERTWPRASHNALKMSAHMCSFSARSCTASRPIDRRVSRQQPGRARPVSAVSAEAGEHQTRATRSSRDHRRVLAMFVGSDWLNV